MADERTTPTWWQRPYAWAAASAVAVLVANVGGIAVGDDGVGYQAIADRLLAGKGLGYFLEPELTIWPPGWPLLMAAVARLTTLSTAQAAIVLNAVTAFVVVLLMHRLLRRLLKDQVLVTLGTAVSALGASSMVFGHLLMTDFAFAAVTLALLLALMNFHRTDEPGWSLLAVALVWVGFMIRYAGVVHIGTVAVWFLLDRRLSWFARLLRAAVFAVAASVVPALWILRNLSTDDTALGVRYSSARGFAGNVYDTVATIGNFLTPGIAIESRAVWAAVAVAGVAVVGAMLWRLVRNDERSRSIAGWADMGAGPLGLVVIHILVYVAYMLYARTTTGLNRLDFRLLNPVYLPLVVVGLAILDRVVRREAAPWPGLARAAAGSWAAVNLVLGLGMVAYFTTSPDLFVGNYERDAFDEVRESPALDALPASCRGRVSSNLPNALYDEVEAQWSPRLTGLESNDPVDDLDRLDADLERRDHCLVWIDLEPRYGHLATLDELRARFDLVEIASDGVVTTYRVTRS